MGAGTVVVVDSSGLVWSMTVSLIGLLFVVCWLLGRMFRDLVVESERMRTDARLRREVGRPVDRAAGLRKSYAPLSQYGRLSAADDCDYDHDPRPAWPAALFESTELKPFKECFGTAPTSA